MRENTPLPGPDAALGIRPPPRLLLTAVHALLAGHPLSEAAHMAGLHTATLRLVLDRPEGAELLHDCTASAALPPEQRLARLRHTFWSTLDRALAQGSTTALALAARLTGLLDRAPAAEPDEPDAEPAPTPSLLAAVRARWNLAPGPDGSWCAPDGRPVLPGRAPEFHDAPGGPVLVLDGALGEAGPDLLATLELLDAETAALFNRSAYGHGGQQWDPRTRTFWYWEGERAVEPGAQRANPPPPPPSSPPDLIGGSVGRERPRLVPGH